MAMSAAASLASLTYYFTTASSGARPSAWNVSLHASAPGTNGADGEVTDSAYARQAANFSVSNADPAAPVASNTETIAFPAAQNGYTASYCVVWDSTNNRPLAIQRLVTDKVIAAGEQAQFSLGELKIGGRN